MPRTHVTAAHVTAAHVTAAHVTAAAALLAAAAVLCASGAGCSPGTPSHKDTSARPISSSDAAVATRRSPVPAASRQLIIGLTKSWTAHATELRLFERSAGGAWRQIGTPWPAEVGKNGLGWGRGLHGAGAPVGAPGPSKREGDGKAAAGVFSIGGAYGYANTPVSGTRLPYRSVTQTWRCVDDVASNRYNTILDSAGIDETWKSAELMRRKDNLYRWVIDIDHNADAPVPGAGSCIFFHVWRGPGQPTVGCTSMARPRIEHLLARLDPAAEPIYVALPEPVYRSLAAQWRLPRLPRLPRR